MEKSAGVRAMDPIREALGVCEEGGIQYPTANKERPMPIGPGAFGCWKFLVGCWVLDSGVPPLTRSSRPRSRARGLRGA